MGKKSMELGSKEKLNKNGVYIERTEKKNNE